jgi:hypothetical protein
MKNKQRGFTDDPFVACVIVAAVLGGFLVAAGFLILPWLWSLLAPLLHAVTAP